MRGSEVSKQYREQQTTIPAGLLLEWLQDPDRKPANVAFTEGPTRVIASVVEALLARERDVPGRKYAALLGSLQGPGGLPKRTTTYMPVLTDPLNPSLTYTKKGFDELMERAIRDLDLYGGQ